MSDVQVNAMTIRDRIDQALTHIPARDSADAFEVTRRLLDLIYRSVKRDARFSALTHDQFDELLGATREEIFADIADLIVGLIDPADVEDVLDREMED
jgi:hypothetical protein